LHYLKDKIQEQGVEVLYLDTDGIILNDNGQDLTQKLNNLIQEWSKDRFGKLSSITIEKSGTFEKLFILALCRYLGYLRTSKGLEREEKGLQLKRADSTNYIAKFQEELFNKIWDKQTQEQIMEFIKSEMERIKTLPIIDISFPAKLGRKIEDYKTIVTNSSGTVYSKKPPIFVQAYQNTQKLNPKWRKSLGDLFYWIYCENNGEVIPLAFDENNQDLIKKICWQKQIQRNVLSIIEPIFIAKNWDNPFIPKKIKREKMNEISEIDNQIELLNKRKQELQTKNNSPLSSGHSEIMDNKDIKKVIVPYYEE